MHASGKMKLITSRNRRRHRERGQALIEFALTAPILLTLLLGTIEIGNGLNSYIKIISVSRDAARLGAQTCGGVSTSCDTNLRNLVTTEAGSLRGNESWVNTDICATNAAGTCITHYVTAASGSPATTTNAVKVKVCYDHPLLVGLPNVIPNPIRMCSSATMRVINP
jgi:Flp pilus assembly protein TadG